MSLTPGTRLGPYEVVVKLGEGGMGEVYQARDTKLNRTVALKILPATFASDPDRLARFRREAQVLASLNHPNIAAIHGFEDSGDTHALVMELVPGRTLAEVASSPMPVAEALPIARQIAAALEAAHEQNVIHRDLKPANIKITDDGTVKVLDFGLAKLAAPEGQASSGATVTSPAMTEMGVILGTAGYMAPEQAKGKPVDRRADIWAMGVVLFEMLAGKALYRGETVTETIAHVITQAPDWNALPASTPAPVRRLLRRCLEKDPRSRFQSAGDVRIEIDEILSGTGSGDTTPGGASLTTAPPAWRRVLPWAIAAMLLAALVYMRWPRQAAPEQQTRLEVRIGSDDDLFVDENIDGPVAVLSPDGGSLVYVGANGPFRRLHLRPLDRLDSTPLAGTDGAAQPFFSYDGRFLAFFANGNLMRMPAGGGALTPIVQGTDPRGGTWGPDDTIVYASGTTTGLSRVRASGGTPTELTTLGPNERTHRWPWFLPGGTAVLFMCQLNNGSYDDGTIEAVRLDNGERKVLIRGGTAPRYVETGHLIYARQNTLYAVRFDPGNLEVLGEPQTVLAGVLASGSGVGAGIGNGAAQYTVASNGTAAYITGTASTDSALRLAIVDRTGNVVYEYPERRAFRDPTFLPDQKRLAVRVGDGKQEHIHLLDPARETLTKLIFEGSFSGVPVITSDSQQMAFASDRAGKALAVNMVKSDGTGGIRAVTPDGPLRVPTSFSPDGRFLAVSEVNPKSNMDLLVLSLEDGKMTPFVASPAIEMMGVFSPDGKWMAYQSAEAGTAFDVFVRAYPGGGALRQVSSGTGYLPRWTKGGRELVYSADAPNAVNIMSVEVAVEGQALVLGKPRKLFDAAVARPANAIWFDAAADGSRFALLLTAGPITQPKRTHVTLVFNFFEEIRRVTGGK